MIAIRQATLDDAREVLENLSEITRTDLEVAGLTEEQVVERLPVYFYDGTVHAMTDNGNVICVCGISLVEDEWFSWSLMKEAFWSPRISIWRMLRRYRDVVLPALSEPVHAYSGSQHPMIARWFHAMGYREAEPVGKLRHFIYPA